MKKSLPPRPNLDHLRKQAKSLLAALDSGDPDAAAAFARHLPAAKGMNPEHVRAAGFRLADAQSAVARQTGFAGWPQLSRHVEQLRSLEGTWEFEHLEIEGTPVPPAGTSSSRILIDGDRFRTESPEAVYEGVFTIDVESDPHGIDIEFIAGPEAGNTNRGLFRLGPDRLEICLDMTGKGRPAGFRTAPGSGHALETLRRSSAARPGEVTGGTPPVAAPAPDRTGQARASAVDFANVASPTLDRLQGEWGAEAIVRDGQALPAFMLATGRRSARGNEVTISFGGTVMIHALVRIDDRADPVAIDYLLQAGVSEGSLQHGIMRWEKDVACFCMAAPGQPRPADFECPAGSGRTLSRWRPKR